jgi:hypothetical protein
MSGRFRLPPMQAKRKLILDLLKLNILATLVRIGFAGRSVALAVYLDLAFFLRVSGGVVVVLVLLVNVNAGRLYNAVDLVYYPNSNNGPDDISHNREV